MKQLVLTIHNGVNLQYPLESLAEFVETEAADSPAFSSELLEQLRAIFHPQTEPKGFLILGLDEEDELLALLAVQEGDQEVGKLQQIISMVVRHDARGQGHGKALLRSARMLSRLGLEVPLPTKHPLHQFFLQQNVDTVELPLS